MSWQDFLESFGGGTLGANLVSNFKTISMAFVNRAGFSPFSVAISYSGFQVGH